MAKNILVVDDSKSVRVLVAATIKEKGYGVVEAGTAPDALAVLGTRRDIAMVICDINMPGMDGIQLLEELARRPAYRGLPVVVLTTEARQQLMDRAKAAGARGWMVKPFNPLVLMAAVQKFAGNP